MSYKTYSFAAGETEKVVHGAGIHIPVTVTLMSSDANRKIEFSTNGGLEYFIPTYDVNTETMLVTYSSIPITNIRATGVEDDVLTITE